MTKEIFEEMLKEFQELNARTIKCREFILDEEKFNSLDMINRDLLIAQLKAMEAYVSILSIRLGINGTPANVPQPEGEAQTVVESESDAEAKADAILAGE